MKKFWIKDGGSYKIDPSSLLAFLENRDYYAFKPTSESNPIYVQIKNNTIKQVRGREIRDYCWRYIKDTYKFQTPEEEEEVIRDFLRPKKPFSPDVLDMLKRVEIKEVKDTKEKSYIFFRNCILEITAEGTVKKAYSELSGHVWEKEFVPFNLLCDVRKEWSPKGEFWDFFQDITMHENKHIQAQNRDSLMTLIGYLLHRYKDPANPKAVIFMDSFKDGNPQGGTGKGILGKALEKIRSTAFVDGKSYSNSDKFKFANVLYGTRILTIDDVPKDFNFEKIFPLITEKAVIERKYENKYTIPFEDSPKILITTNYTLGGQGSSHRRRKVEFILSDTYSAENTPEDRFGHLLFNDWDQQEWENFYLFMAHCLQMYLLMGIVEPHFNVAERSLKQTVTEDFIQHANVAIEPNVKYNKKKKYDDFLAKFPKHAKIGQNSFTKWVKLYADACSMKVTETHSGGANFFELTIRD